MAKMLKPNSDDCNKMINNDYDRSFEGFRSPECPQRSSAPQQSSGEMEENRSPGCESLPISATPREETWVQTKTTDGQIYFYHSTTKETTWDRPLGPGIRIVAYEEYQYMNAKVKRSAEKADRKSAYSFRGKRMSPIANVNTSRQTPSQAPARLQQPFRQRYAATNSNSHQWTPPRQPQFQMRPYAQQPSSFQKPFKDQSSSQGVVDLTRPTWPPSNLPHNQMMAATILPDMFLQPPPVLSPSMYLSNPVLPHVFPTPTPPSFQWDGQPIRQGVPPVLPAPSLQVMPPPVPPLASYPGNSIDHSNLINTSLIQRASEWSEYISPNGMPYYHNMKTGVVTWEKPQALVDFQKLNKTTSGSRLDAPAFGNGSTTTTMKKQGVGRGTTVCTASSKCIDSDTKLITKPVSSQSVFGTTWYIVCTNDKRIFYYNVAENKSYWNRPTELIGRADVDELYKTCKLAWK